MTKVYCEHCGKFLFETETPSDNLGSIASEAQHKGFVAKLPVFYGVEHFVFFCDKECSKTWINEHSTPEQREEADKVVGEMRKTMESKEFREGLLDGLSKIQQIVKTFNKKL